MKANDPRSTRPHREREKVVGNAYTHKNNTHGAALINANLVANYIVTGDRRESIGNGFQQGEKQKAKNAYQIKETFR